MNLKSSRRKNFRRFLYGAASLLLSASMTTALAQDATEPLLGSIAMVSFNFAPRGWALCEGQLLAINTNQALFSLLGTTYGGDGRTTFALPDLRGRVAVDAASLIQLGERGGEESHTVTINELPAHTHLENANSSIGTDVSPVGTMFARDASSEAHYGSHANAVMNGNTVGLTGGSQPHENRMPFIAIHYIIALQGIFPSRN